MRPSQTLVSALADRLCRPQRIGLFGHRGVGKTTLLTMLYREAVGGRLPDLRLAAADTRTAEYLSGKILELEAGRRLPATLAETELRFHLYHRSARIDLLFKDYQGEHVELGREEPIREFLRDCDAVWLCLDAGAPAGGELLRSQQEVEQLIEDYLASEPPAVPRPTALVLTKADLLDPETLQSGRWAAPLDMTLHALHTHCPRSGLFAVSSLGRQGDLKAPAALAPLGLAEPLAWLAEALQAQDETRLDRLWSLAGNRLTLLSRCVETFARRYPEAPATAEHLRRLKRLLRRRRLRRGLVTAGAAACLLAGFWSYDAWGYHQASRFQAEHATEPAAVLHEWQQYRDWHPTRNWLRPAAGRAEEDRLRSLKEEARRQEYAEGLADLRRASANPDADPEALWQQFHDFHAAFPEADPADLDPLRATLKARRDEQLALRARRAHEDLVSAEQHLTDLSALLAQAERFLRDYPDSLPAADVRRRRDAYALRLDERDIQPAREFSAYQPLAYRECVAQYQRYLDRHPGGGAFSREAQAAVERITAEWDRHDFGAVRDQFESNPGDIPELVARCRTYLGVHPRGKFAPAAADLLRWSERVTSPGEYRVVLRSGHFEKSVAHFFSRGPDLSVELEVNGVRYGPSTIVVNRYDPEWNFEFPRRISWKLGEPIHIRVTDHDWKDRVVLDIHSADHEPLAMQLLTGEVWLGANRLTFESDFALPVLPPVE